MVVTSIYEHPLVEHVDPIAAHIWSNNNQIAVERSIWLEVLRFHMEAGVVSHQPQILEQLAYSIWWVDLDSIEQRERRLRHDLMARLEETIAVAGIPEVLHLGMTSADVVENSFLIRMAETCDELSDRPGFTHLTRWPEWLTFRGIKGPVGTQQDQLDLLGTDELCQQLDRQVASRFGFVHVANSVGQVMWRSSDLMWATQLASTIVDDPWRTLATGYLQMIAGYAGDTWNEGDVASSSVRRIAIPGMALTATAQSVHNMRKQEQCPD